MKIEPIGTAKRFVLSPEGLITAEGLDGQSTIMASIDAAHREVGQNLVNRLNHLITSKRKWARIWTHLRLLEPDERGTREHRIDVIGYDAPRLRKPFAILVGRPSGGVAIEILQACALFHFLINACSPTCGRVALGWISIENPATELASCEEAMKNGRSVARRRHLKNRGN